jgi:uncharacterized protein YceK
MSRMTAPLVLLGAVLAAGGCGTVANLKDHEQIYGGTSMDHASLVRAYKEITHPDDPHELTEKQDLAVILGTCVDLPMSAIADTFTLPITCYHWLKDGSKQPEAGSAVLPMPTSSPPPLASAPATASAAAGSAR